MYVNISILYLIYLYLIQLQITAVSFETWELLLERERERESGSVKKERNCSVKAISIMNVIANEHFYCCLCERVLACVYVYALMYIT